MERTSYGAILRVFLVLAVMVFATVPVMAQDKLFAGSMAGPGALGEVTSEPQCFNVINQAPYKVHGTIITNYYINEEGIRARHRSTFRLETSERAEFCTFGPFYDGRKVDLVLRTLIPIFECRTGISEDIVIYGRRKSEGGTETWATCL